MRAIAQDSGHRPPLWQLLFYLLTHAVPGPGVVWDCAGRGLGAGVLTRLPAVRTGPGPGGVPGDGLWALGKGKQKQWDVGLAILTGSIFF